MNTKTHTSEWVSTGHPDKTCDYIASYLLDRYLELDPRTRFALEVQMKDDHVTLGGEIASDVRFTRHEISGFVRDAVREVGYTREYRRRWGARNVPCSDDLDVIAHIGRQSADIAQGVDADAWGDQGIFWGMATGCRETGGMPLDHWLARRAGLALLESGIGGIDVKTQITLREGTVTRAIAAIPLPDEESGAAAETILRRVIGSDSGAEVIVNGTGRYTTHGSVGDCGTTGRKLAVDFYGGNCRIGGGCPWGKDPTKADVSLNVYARRKALECVKEHGLEVAFASIACCIGRREIDISVYDGRGDLVEEYRENRPASEIIRELGLDAPVFARLCGKGLFHVA